MGVPHEFLDDAQIGPTVQEMRGKRVAQHVRVDGAVYSRSGGVLLQQLLHPAGQQTAATAPDEHGGLTLPCENLGPAVLHVGIEGSGRRFSHQRDAFLGALPADSNLAAVDIEEFNAYVTPRIAFRLALSLLSRWRLAARFLRGCFESKPTRVVPAELLLLFVDRQSQRSRTGTLLLQTLEEDFTRAAVTEYRVSVRSELEQALAFYAARGFQHEGELIVLGRSMTYLTKRLEQ